MQLAKREASNYKGLNGGRIVWDQRVAGSNPAAPTNPFKALHGKCDPTIVGPHTIAHIYGAPTPTGKAE